MTRIEKQIVVNRPVEDVLRFAKDWRTIPRYLDYIQEVKPLTEHTEGDGPGTWSTSPIWVAG